MNPIIIAPIALILVAIGYTLNSCKSLFLSNGEGNDEEYDAETGQRSRIRHEGGI